MTNPIYAPEGAAAEYGELALNIYTGCPHRCFYCFAPLVLHRVREKFHRNVEPRAGIVEATARQLERKDVKGKTVHLCFTCDPYPVGHDTTPTREIIKLIKAAGGHVQILTKGDGTRDFDLLDENDWYGVTYTGATWDMEPGTVRPVERIFQLVDAHAEGIKTWCSFEPVVGAEAVLSAIRETPNLFDRVKIGKLNYHESDINWAEFGRRAEEACKAAGLEYYIKDSLRREMEGAGA